MTTETPLTDALHEAEAQIARYQGAVSAIADAIGDDATCNPISEPELLAAHVEAMRLQLAEARTYLKEARGQSIRASALARAMLQVAEIVGAKDASPGQVVEATERLFNSAERDRRARERAGKTGRHEQLFRVM